METVPGAWRPPWYSNFLPVPPNTAVTRIAVATTVLAAAWGLLLLQVGPVPVWFYVFAWYPTLVILDGLATRLDARPSLFGDRALTLSLFGWSPIVWLTFEAANLRLDNWYYVSLPPGPVARWTGILLSFATVIPAIVLAERALDAAGIFRRGAGPGLVVRAWQPGVAMWIGLGAAAVSLAWPERFFPLIWGAAFPLADPVLYRHAPHLSLIRDMEAGRWGRIGRLMLAGLGIGLVWETYNWFAAGAWVYTIPGIDGPKLFQMPLPGYLGFPLFALEAWSMYGVLCTAKVAVAPAGTRSLSVPRTIAAGLVAVVFAALVLLGMERLTIT